MAFFKRFAQSKPSRIYLDVASSTPLDMDMLKTFPQIPAEVLAANPSALHKEGVALKRYLSDARELVTKTLFAHADEIVFTSNATESDNIALHGVMQGLLQKGMLPHEILFYTSDIEHAAVIETVSVLTRLGVQHKVLKTIDGVIDPKDIVVSETEENQKELSVKAVIVSVMYVNNEIGTVQPIKLIAKRLRFLRKQHPAVTFFFHTDATQAPLHFSLNVAQLGVDMMTLGATKLYCPKGVGMLYVRRNIPMAPIQFGGGQEFGLRPGTEPVQLIHDFAHALSYAQSVREEYGEKILDLQTYIENRILEDVPVATITARVTTESTHERSPHITHVTIPNFDSELLVLELDARGIAVSAKSACKNEEGNESVIAPSLQHDFDGKNVGTLRFSFGRHTTKEDLDRAVNALVAVLEKYQQTGK